MNGNTTAIERLLEVSNKLWDDMYESGEVPTYAERAHYYLALKDAMDENAKLRELASILCFCMQVHAQCDDCKLNGAKGELAHDPLCACDGLHEILRELGIEVPS